MRFYKAISVFLHPIVVPTIGVFLYFLLIPNQLKKEQRLVILAIVFVATYLIPLLSVILLKKLKRIQSYQVTSIKERKLPLVFMIMLFYLLGNILFGIAQVRDLGILFYATSLGLIVTYTLFVFKINTSLHLLFIGIVLGFYLLMTTFYTSSFLPILIIILLSGLLGSARLYLKKNTLKEKEVYIGFFLGIVSPFLVSYFL